MNEFRFQYSRFILWSDNIQRVTVIIVLWVMFAQCDKQLAAILVLKQTEGEAQGAIRAHM